MQVPPSNRGFGEAPIPRLPFLRLKSPPPKCKKANISKVAKFRPGDQVVLIEDEAKGLSGLRSAEIKKIEFANPNYAPRLRGDEPEAVYLVKLDSTDTTIARCSPRWVREEAIEQRPAGTQWDAWQLARPRWDRVWDENRDFEQIAEKQSPENVKKTLREVSLKLIKTLSVARLLELPVSRFEPSEEAKALGLRPERRTLKRGGGLKSSTSSDAILYGMFSRVPRRLSPLRAPSPQRRHRQPSCPRQVRVRNQIAQPTENPTVIDARRRNPWYAEYKAPPPYLTRHTSSDEMKLAAGRAAADLLILP
jgi:hypothetical protein